MKKFIYLASAATLALASCSDDFMPGNNNVAVEGNSRIVATYEFGSEEEGTRTSLNGNYQYVWGQGDAISVIGSAENLYVNNAMYFNPAEDAGTEATFVGQANLTNNKKYFGIYPYDTNLAYNKSNTYTVAIRANQNFNEDANELQAIPTGNVRANGSFSNGDAPAVAVATANNGQLEFSFQPLASYLVFPFSGTGKVKSMSLQINVAQPVNGNNNINRVPRPLVGSFSVNFNNLSPDGKVNLSNINNTGNNTTGDFEPAEGNNNTTITLNCGSGVQLDTEEVTNFWFVVPNGIKLAGAEIILTVNGNEKIVKTFSDNWMGSDGSNQTLRNNVRWIWQGAQTPFQYNAEGNYYVITKPWQFLEYVYAVSNPQATVLKQYYNLAGTHNTDYNLNYTDLYNIVPTLNEIMQTYNPENGLWTTDAKYYVKDALIAGNIVITQEAIKKYLSGVSINGLAQYYQDVYVNYMNYGYINQIGGYTPYTMTGIGYDGTISGTAQKPFIVKGNGIFRSQDDESLAQNIEALTFEYVQADVTGLNEDFFNFLATPDNVNFSGVTVDPSCSIKGNSLMADEGLFTFVRNVDIDVIDVENGTEDQEAFPYFAQYLSIDKAVVNDDIAFYFTSGVNRTVADFMYVVMPRVEEYANSKSTMQVLDEEEAILLMNKLNMEVPEYLTYDMVPARRAAQTYSVIDEETSYWTGTTYQVQWYPLQSKLKTTAEQLAYAAQNGNGKEYKLVLDRNICLMGDQFGKGTLDKYTQYWWASPANVNVSSPTGEKYTIENAYLNGTKDGKTPATSGANVMGLEGQYNFMTLLGMLSTVNNVNIKNMVVTPTVEKNPAVTYLVAALSVNPAAKSSNVNVTMQVGNMTGYGTRFSYVDENNKSYSVIGGFYYNLDQASLALLSNYTISTGTQPTGAHQGYLAAVLNDQITAYATYTNPVNDADPSWTPFGYTHINILAQNQENTSVTFNGFGDRFITKDRMNEWFSCSGKTSYTVFIYLGKTYSTTFYYTKDGNPQFTYAPGVSETI